MQWDVNDILQLRWWVNNILSLKADNWQNEHLEQGDGVGICSFPVYADVLMWLMVTCKVPQKQSIAQGWLEFLYQQISLDSIAKLLFDKRDIDEPLIKYLENFVRFWMKFEDFKRTSAYYTTLQ